MKHLLIIPFFCFFCIVKLSAQNSEIVFIRVQEASKTSASGFESKIVVIKPDNTT